MSQTSRDRVNSRSVRTHEENSGETVRRLGTIIQNIFCAQSGASIRLTFWIWSSSLFRRSSRHSSEFANYMESILLSKEQLLIVGDMHHVDDAGEAGAPNFLDLLESLALKQHVRGPTHIHGHTLDLVVTRLAENIILDTPKADRYLSDHAAILCKLTSSKPLNTVKEVKYRRTKSVDISALSCDLWESSLCRDVLSNSHPDILSACDLDSLACNYNTTLSSVIESHAPLKTKTIVSRPTVPWYNDDILKAKLLRRKVERK